MFGRKEVEVGGKSGCGALLKSAYICRSLSLASLGVLPRSEEILQMPAEQGSSFKAWLTVHLH